jgi:hypothetical protein
LIPLELNDYVTGSLIVHYIDRATCRFCLLLIILVFLRNRGASLTKQHETSDNNKQSYTYRFKCFHFAFSLPFCFSFCEMLKLRILENIQERKKAVSLNPLV